MANIDMTKMTVKLCAGDCNQKQLNNLFKKDRCYDTFQQLKVGGK
jgi:hypothetical protein